LVSFLFIYILKGKLVGGFHSCEAMMHRHNTNM
jgi:hypothetical protein